MSEQAAPTRRRTAGRRSIAEKVGLDVKMEPNAEGRLDVVVRHDDEIVYEFDSKNVEAAKTKITEWAKTAYPEFYEPSPFLGKPRGRAKTPSAPRTTGPRPSQEAAEMLAKADREDAAAKEFRTAADKAERLATAYRSAAEILADVD